MKGMLWLVGALMVGEVGGFLPALPLSSSTGQQERSMASLGEGWSKGWKLRGEHRKRETKGNLASSLSAVASFTNPQDILSKAAEVCQPYSLCPNLPRGSALAWIKGQDEVLRAGRGPSEELSWEGGSLCRAIGREYDMFLSMEGERGELRVGIENDTGTAHPARFTAWTQNSCSHSTWAVPGVRQARTRTTRTPAESVLPGRPRSQVIPSPEHQVLARSPGQVLSLSTTRESWHCANFSIRRRRTSQIV
eukprot:753875-Hanusia_phi.AAC.5